MNFLDFAKQVAKEAGKMINSYSSDSIAIESKGSIRDVVTKVDRASEQLIKHRISEKFPNHQILGEEESFENKDVHTRILNQINTIPFLWIVDPIDGTNNFVQNIPGFVVSIALKIGRASCRERWWKMQ